MFMFGGFSGVFIFTLICVDVPVFKLVFICVVISCVFGHVHVLHPMVIN